MFIKGDRRQKVHSILKGQLKVGFKPLHQLDIITHLAPSLKITDYQLQNLHGQFSQKIQYCVPCAAYRLAKCHTGW